MPRALQPRPPGRRRCWSLRKWPVRNRTRTRTNLSKLPASMWVNSNPTTDRRRSTANNSLPRGQNAMMGESLRRHWPGSPGSHLSGDRGSSNYEIVLKTCNECVLKGQHIALAEIYNDVRTNLRRLRHHISERIDLGDTGEIDQVMSDLESCGH